MNLLAKYRIIKEATGSTVYGAGNQYTARVVSKGGVHTAKFFKDGVHMRDADYTHPDKEDVHNFAQDEVTYRKKNSKEAGGVTERIVEPQGHMETADHITDDSEDGLGKKKKQMGNRTPLEIIAKILAGR